MMSRKLSQMTAYLAAIATVGLLAACSPTETLLGVKANTAVVSTGATLSTRQASTIAIRALSKAQLADTRMSEAEAATAYTGLALRTAAPSYVVQRADSRDDTSATALRPVPQPTRVVITAGTGFPRTMMAVWSPPGRPVPQLAVMTSDKVGSPYRVSARTNLIPGTILPATSSNARGAQILSTNAPGLVATPQQAVADLALLLQTGRSGRTAFATSTVVSEVRANAAAQAKRVSKVARLQQKRAADNSVTRVIQTADGGALVIGAITRTEIFTVVKGIGFIIPDAPEYRALAPGVKKINVSATVSTVEVVAIVLPPKDKGKAQLVGFDSLPVAVKAR